MKKNLIYLVLIKSFLVLSVIIPTYFMADIFNFMKLAGVNFSTTLSNPDFAILLCISLVGIVNIRRNRGAD